MFGEQLRATRTEKGFTQYQLAKKLGVSTSTIGMYEQGRRTPDCEMLCAICKVLQVSSDQLLELPSSPNISTDFLQSLESNLNANPNICYNGKQISLSSKQVEKIITAIKLGIAMGLSD